MKIHKSSVQYYVKGLYEDLILNLDACVDLKNTKVVIEGTIKTPITVININHLNDNENLELEELLIIIRKVCAFLLLEIVG